MKGLITDAHWKEIEATFPGIHQFHDQMEAKPATFLDLWQAFLAARDISHQQTVSPNTGTRKDCLGGDQTIYKDVYPI